MPLIRIPRWPDSLPRSESFRVRVGGVDVPCFSTDSGDFAWAAVDGPVACEVTAPAAWNQPVVRPSSRRVAAELKDGVTRFEVSGPMYLCVENGDGQTPRVGPLFLFLDAPGAFEPPAGRCVDRVVAAGQVHSPAVFEVREGETVFLEPGAVVDGPVRATRAVGGALTGCGWFRARPSLRQEGFSRLFLAQAADGFLLDGPLFTNPPAWTVMWGACDDVRVRRVKTLTWRGGQDGIDVVGCRRMRIADCCLRNGDDCIVVKAFDTRREGSEYVMSFARDVDDVVAEGCVLYNTAGGNGLEIGHELRVERVSNITFRDCDIVAVHQFGAPFSIHAYDRAVVEDVLFERIRVDHHYDMLLDLRVSRSRYSADAERGHIRRVTFRDVDVALSPYNAGYTKSVIGGWDPQHLADDIRFERFRVDGRVMRNVDDLELFTRHVGKISFSE